MRRLLTTLLLFACVLLFLIDVGTSAIAPSSPYPSVTAFNPLRKWLLFDYPHAVALEDLLIEKEATEPLSFIDSPTIDAFNKSSFWGGVSLSFFAHVTGLPMVPRPSIDHHLLFEKILQGELWRLFTPALLHGSLLHLLFNMTWLYVLGRQIEERIGGALYLLFVVLTGIFTNVTQYLVSGYAFLGFSGILLAMAAFIATRQKIFPKEGFFLEKHLYTFFKVVVFAFASLSLLLFGLVLFKRT